MKKLFKLLWILEIVGALRGHRRHGHHGYGYRRSHSYHPLYRSPKRALMEHGLRRLLHGRRY